jgi:hypothetical protein
MEPSFPHILNPQIASFGPMVDNSEPAPQEDPSIAPAPNEFIQDTTALNGSRKRPISRIKSTYPRKRAIQACQKCRARRTKCNNVRPACSSCLDLGVECNYAESDPSRYVTSLSPYACSAESFQLRCGEPRHTREVVDHRAASSNRQWTKCSSSHFSICF